MPWEPLPTRCSMPCGPQFRSNCTRLWAQTLVFQSTSRDDILSTLWQAVAMQTQRSATSNSGSRTALLRMRPVTWQPARIRPETGQKPASSALTGTQFLAFVTGCLAQYYLQYSVCSLAHFRANARPLRHKEPDNDGPLSHTELPALATETFLLRRQSRYC